MALNNSFLWKGKGLRKLASTSILWRAPSDRIRNLLPGRLYVGIDLGTTHIKVAGLRLNQRSATLQFYSVVDLVETYEVETIEDIRPEHYVEQLRKIAEEYKIEKAVLNTTVPANKALIDTIKVPVDQTGNEVAETIQRELAQVSLAPLAEMQIACHTLSDEGSDGNSISLLSCAVPNQILENHRTLLAECGLTASVIELDAFSLYNAMYYFINKKIGEPVTLIHVGAAYTVCLIMQPHKVPFFYVIEKGGNQVTNGIMEEIGLPFFKAEAFKKKMQKRNWPERSQFRESRLSCIYSEFAQELLREVRKCVRHYQTHQGITTMSNVFLTGGSANLPYLIEKSKELLSFPTRVWNPLNHFRKQATQRSENSDETGHQLPIVLGAVLRGD